jgi:hypothetical protein
MTTQISPEWRAVPGYEGLYEVSSAGDVRAVDKMQRYLLRNGVEAFRFVPGHLISQKFNNRGYRQVHLYKGNSCKMMLAHRLVALAFITQTDPEVDHINHDRTDCNVTNLRWVSRSVNLRNRRK